ncbi:MAG: hypothetical protein KKA10_06675 [Euryarchaeota archaeon]|nr:hypothetical protein [Euryarchaeota archaeon]MCG2736876.1 hypothetical protein [Candidatus Methanoperedenaceae archaeon]
MKTKLAYKKISGIEQEIRSLKKLFLSRKKVVSLRGMLKGILITEDEIEDAKRSLFRA